MKNKITVNLNYEEYRDRVRACWIGKNIGGTMGAPYECKREMQNISGFATDFGKPLPNDDLDLQLIWLHAVETMGPLAINAAVLGEFWLGLIPPNWNEYGIGKANMRRGLIPPISGDYDNSWKDSNGAWIRTEVWACMAPGCPALAAKYAMEDGKVDHGAGEGTMAAAFVAAMQSAAFIVSDIRTCINMGLTAIPEGSRMADSVRFVLECRDKGMTYVDARNAVQERNSDIGNGWFEAPSNVSYALIGLLWGEGDFKKSMITAINCGDDTDCTGATVGATLGIMYGMKNIPEDWQKHIGDDIITISINKGHIGSGGRVPKTCSELTERVVAQAPTMLLANHANVQISESENLIPENIVAEMENQCKLFRDTTVYRPYSARFESTLLNATLIIERAPDIAPGEEISFKILVESNLILGDDIINLTCRWWLPEGFTLCADRKTASIGNISSHSKNMTELNFTVKAGEKVDAVNRCVLEIVPEGRCTPLYIPVILLG